MKLHHLLTVIEFGTDLLILYNGLERITTYNSPMDYAISDIINCNVKNVAMRNGRLVIEL